MQSLLRLGLLFLPCCLTAQEPTFPMQTIPLNDLSAFRPVSANWHLAGDVQAVPDQDDALATQPGTGILVNTPDATHRENLLFGFEHGDIDLELDVLMARHSNSGIYLQGRYEIQLFDSWGKMHPSFSDIGGVYERWDDNKPEGRKGFQGVAPLLNAARAPGLWQHLRIEFQAPRFDDAGHKTANARLLRVVLNGMTIQENVELTGPTRGPMQASEAAAGPILIQGDHGPVAFRNIRYRMYDSRAPELRNLKYRYFAGEYDNLPDFRKIKAESAGTAEGLSWELAKGDNDFALQFTGVLHVPESGKYQLTAVSNGNSMVQLNGDTLIGPGWNRRSADADLPAGDVPIEITYCKAVDWVEPALGLFIEGLHLRPAALHLPGSLISSKPVAPILLDPGNEPEMLRSFIDIPTGTGRRKRIVHAISVGFPDGQNYSYDLDNGALVQFWKGRFLDVTPMWHERGDGHANPNGSVVFLGDMPGIALATASRTDTLPAEYGYRLNGYRLDETGAPAFRYTAYGVEVEDRIVPDESGKTMSRHLSFTGTALPDLRFRIASGSNIQKIGSGLWAVDDKAYFIKLPDAGAPEVRHTAAGSELWLPVTQEIRYQLIW